MLDAECRCVLHSKINRSTSALGQKQTSGHDRLMSALPPIADITESDWDVRFVPNGDISNGFTRVCFEWLEPIRQSEFSVENVGNPAPGIKSQIKDSRWQHCSAMAAASSAHQRGGGKRIR